ncbi:MAG: ribonuclease HI [Deltaproteobacteria bacterium]|nr:ribonuclease HI [Deltaproteobacteria bacterium]
MPAAAPKAAARPAKAAGAKPTAGGAGGASALGGPGRGVTFAAGGGGRADALRFWTDGACSGNPGPAGSGVFAELGGTTWELSEYLGHTTNNVAELTAILRALERVEDPTRPVDILSDSEYGLKVAAKIYKAKKNLDLVEGIWSQLGRFKDLRLVKVPAHVGIPGNERADELARLAITNRATASVER